MSGGSTSTPRATWSTSTSAISAGDSSQLLDPEGRPPFRWGPPPVTTLPLSPQARLNATRGLRTFETLEDPQGGPFRLLTVPVQRSDRSVEIIQVSAPLARTREALARYLTTLLALVPVAVGLAAAG